MHSLEWMPYLHLRWSSKFEAVWQQKQDSYISIPHHVSAFFSLYRY